MSSKISIIIPVYNVEQYIAKCIQSLLDQTYHSFEALIIDDGSSDESIKIAKALVGNDSRFIFLEKENGGLSSARNFGLDHATGDYILFLDSDDYLEKDCLEKVLLAFVSQPDIDIVIFGFNIVDENRILIQQKISCLDQYDKLNDILLSKNTLSFNVADKVYRKKLWNDLRFIEGIIYEDKQLMPQLLFEKKLYILNKFLYCYVQRNGSIMHSYNLKRSVESTLIIYIKYKEFLIFKELYAQYQDYYQEAYIKYCFYQHLYMILAHSSQYKLDCQYLITNIDTKIVSLNNVRKYYGFASKQFITFMLFKISPVLMKNVLNLKLGLQRLLKRSQ